MAGVRKKVVVAMSGGVDSSLAVFLLRERGYDVIGATMSLWKGKGQEDLPRCYASSHVEEAQQVADQLGIPFQVVHLEEEFEKEIVQYFCKEYGRGKTPNPCVLCNRKIKFGVLLEKARELGADYLATGHYARLEVDDRTGRSLLKKGVDETKDQSYVLFSLSQNQFQQSLFPLGEYRKGDVRKKAQQLGLRVHDKAESQEVCFIADNSYHPFLAARLKESIVPGPIMDRTGHVIGMHKGIPFYTIGQRRGLGLAKGVPLYVIGIDPKKNAVMVGKKEDVLADTFTVRVLNWIIPQEKTFSAQVKIRYNHPGAEALVTSMEEDELEVRFHVPQKAITPGQAAVFYDGEAVIGGGWIEKVVRS
jgi:tRNA-specific 2-thiouridylase